MVIKDNLGGIRGVFGGLLEEILGVIRGLLGALKVFRGPLWEFWRS